MTYEECRKHFYYKDGVIYWKHCFFKNLVGKEAGNVGINTHHRIHQKRHLIHFNNRTYYRSRVVFLYHHGRWPMPTCDHINRDTLDDRIENLREATLSVQNKNKGVFSNTGHRHITRKFDKRGKAYYLVSLRFYDEKEAIRVRDLAVKKLKLKLRSDCKMVMKYKQVFVIQKYFKTIKESTEFRDVCLSLITQTYVS